MDSESYLPRNWHQELDGALETIDECITLFKGARVSDAKNCHTIGERLYFIRKAKLWNFLSQYTSFEQFLVEKKSATPIANKISSQYRTHNLSKACKLSDLFLQVQRYATEEWNCITSSAHTRIVFPTNSK